MPTSPFLLKQLPWVIAIAHLPNQGSRWENVTVLGNEQFFLFLVPLLYLCVSPRLGARLAVLLLVSESLNVLAKMAFGWPRPYWISTDLYPLYPEASFGMPSSHAQNAVAVWLFLAHSRWRAVPRALAYAAAAVLILAISFSRVYLQVHFPSDVAAGWVLGGMVLLGFLRWETWVRGWLAARPRRRRLTLVAGLPWLLPVGGLLLTRGSSVSFQGAMNAGWLSLWGRTGALCGLGVALVLADPFAKFQPAGPWWRRVVALLVALLGVVICRLQMLSNAMPDITLFALHAFCYATMTFWVAYGAPKLLLRWRLLQSI